MTDVVGGGIWEGGGCVAKLHFKFKLTT